MYSPFRMWKNLHQFLCLWIAIWVTDIIRFLPIVGISWAAVEMISRIRKSRCLISIYFLASRTNMIRRAGDQIIWAAPACSCWIYYHFTVSCHICQNITITGVSIVLPTASYVKEIKLTVGSSSLFNIKCQLYLKVRRLRQLAKQISKDKTHEPQKYDVLVKNKTMLDYGNFDLQKRKNI